MAWVVRRDGAQGKTFKGVYRDPDGVQRSAGTFTSRRAAERAAWLTSPSAASSRSHSRRRADPRAAAAEFVLSASDGTSPLCRRPAS